MGAVVGGDLVLGRLGNAHGLGQEPRDRPRLLAGDGARRELAAAPGLDHERPLLEEGLEQPRRAVGSSGP